MLLHFSTQSKNNWQDTNPKTNDSFFILVVNNRNFFRDSSLVRVDTDKLISSNSSQRPPCNKKTWEDMSLC